MSPEPARFFACTEVMMADESPRDPRATLPGALARASLPYSFDLDRVMRAVDLLEAWVQGEAGSVADTSPSTAELRARFEAGEDPQALIEALGLSPEEAAEIDFLSRCFAGAPGIFRAAMISRTERAIFWAEKMDEWARGGSPEADWAIVMLPFDFSEGERTEALQRILSRIGNRPIHPSRWGANRGEILAAADDLELDIRELGERVSWVAVREALEALTVREAREDQDLVVSRFRAAVQRLVCEELLPGHDWKNARRRDAPLDEVDHRRTEEDALAAAAVRLDLARLLDAADLTEAERELADAFAWSGHWPSAARDLDIQQDAMRQRKRTLMAKLKKAAGM